MAQITPLVGEIAILRQPTWHGVISLRFAPYGDYNAASQGPGKAGTS